MVEVDFDPGGTGGYTWTFDHGITSSDGLGVGYQISIDGGVTWQNPLSMDGGGLAIYAVQLGGSLFRCNAASGLVFDTGATTAVGSGDVTDV